MNFILWFVETKSGIKNLYSTTFHLKICQKFYNFSFLEFQLGMAMGRNESAKRERKKKCVLNNGNKIWQKLNINMIYKN